MVLGMSMNYWLMKTEPSEFSIDDLQKASGQITSWEGVRNYQARNMMRSEMKLGDKVFFYHSNCDIPGIVGIAKVVKESVPDTSAFDPHSKYFDPKSKQEAPTWFCVDVQYVKKLPRTISLHELKNQTALADFPLVRRGNRLSILPVTASQWEMILALLD